MLESILIEIAGLAGAVYLLTALAVRWTYRFAARCHPAAVPAAALPQPIALLIEARIPELQELGFELIGCFDCGSLAGGTRSYVAQFCNRRSNEFANVSALVTPAGVASYVEFSTRFTNGLLVETNTNRVLPLTPAAADSKVFRFPGIEDARTLLHVHHHLVDKYAAGLWPQPELFGQEIQRFVRVIENYGPRHARAGYMRLAEDSQSYRLTWKGALLITGRRLWPISLFRRWIQSHDMHAELRSLQIRGVTALQKA